MPGWQIPDLQRTDREVYQWQVENIHQKNVTTKDRVLQGMKKGNVKSLNRHIMTSCVRFANRKKMLQTGLNIRITQKDANLKRPRKEPGASNKYSLRKLIIRGCTLPENQYNTGSNKKKGVYHGRLQHQYYADFKD